MDHDPSRPNPDAIDPRLHIPDVFAGVLDSEALLALGMIDLDGVPVPYLLQSAEKLGGWIDRLDTEGATSTLVADVDAEIRAMETDYPSVQWEKYRAGFGYMLVRLNRVDEALSFLAGAQSLYPAVALAVDQAMERGTQGEDASALVGPYLRLMELVGPERQSELLRAFIDHVIEKYPDTRAIERFENTYQTYRRRDGLPPILPVQSWAEAQQRRFPEVDWQQITCLILDESAWQGIPLPYRQSSQMFMNQVQRMLHMPVDAEAMQNVLRVFAERFEEAYPNARIWNELKGLIVLHALDLGRAEAARIVGESMPPDWQGSVVASMLRSGAIEQAEILALSITDAEQLIGALFLEGWPDNKGTALLEGICWSDDHQLPLARRIACVEAVHDGFVLQGNDESAARYATRLEELRQQQNPGQPAP